MTPAMLIDVLASLRGRLRAWTGVFGLGVVLAAAVFGLAAIAGLDWLVHLSRAWRVLLDVALLAGVGWLVARRVVTPLVAPLSINTIAGRVERRFPQFEDRLQSAVGFIESPTPDSPTLQRATIAQAVDLASALPLADVLDPRPALRAAGLGVGLLIAAAGGVALVDPASRSILLSRVFNPLGHAAWPNRVEIAFVGPQVDRVASGGQVNVKLRLTRGDSPRARPTIYYVDQDGVERQEYLTRGDDGQYGVSLDAKGVSTEKGGSLKWWVVAGDARSAETNVAVLPKLTVETVLAALAPPPYVAGASAKTYDLGGRSTSTLFGSTATFTVRFSKPIPDAASVKLIAVDDGDAPSVAWSSVDPQTVTGIARVERTARFRVDARDADGFSVSGSGDYEIAARADEPPTITIENPRRNSEERTAEATVPLVAVAADDAGVRDVSLVVKKLGATAQEWTLPIVASAAVAVAGDADVSWTKLVAEDDRARFRLSYAWTLASLNASLKPGDVLEYVVRVADNYESDGQRHPPVDSAKLRITIISQEQLAARAVDEVRQVRRQVDEVKKEHDRATADTAAMRDDVAKKPTLDAADKAINARLRQQLGTGASATKTAAERLEALRQMMEENKSDSSELAQMSKDVAAQLAATSEGPMKSALGAMGNVESSPTPPARADAADKALADERRASEELGAAIKRLDEVGSLNAAIDEFKRALEAQRALTEDTRGLAAKTAGQTMDKMNAGDRAAMAKAVAAQADLAAKTQKMLDKLGKTADRLSKADPATSDAMKAAQKQGQSKGVSQNQKQAAQQMQQSQQSNAKQSQQQAEAGLEVVLSQLQAAQSRKLAELQKKLAELQAQIAILVRRQSGHNLDNLTLQGGDIVTAQAETIALLTTKSERKPGEPAPQVPRLLSAQGQTQRNALDIAKKAADVPDGAEPAARISRAATLMERAAVYVKDKKLAEAYQPPQLDALAALDEAARIIDEQKQKVDDQIAGQQQEAIRQAFIRIRGEQDKLAVETKRIDGTRSPEGKLNRGEAVRVGQLPGEQQRLADDVAKTGESLVALQSVVYTWANKQIGASMDDAKAKLAAADTSGMTQRLHVRTIADLDAMIENLKVTPRERKFESGGGGGGGQGGGAKPMPPEAELRMLKSLQVTVNQGTQQADQDRAAKAAAEAIEASVVALGRRQTEVRGLLDELMKTASKGESTLGSPAAEETPLPEEQQLQKIDDQELTQALVGGDPGANAKAIDLQRVGDRMARSGHRLEADRDPGKVTQVVQQRILGDFDLLIEEARQQQCGGGKGSPSSAPPQAPKPDAGAMAKAQNKGQNKPGGAKAAQTSSPGGQTGVASASGKSIEETAEEWGRISPRLHGPFIESRDETIVERYKRLVEDYTQAVSTEASGGGNASTPAAPTSPATGGQ